MKTILRDCLLVAAGLGLVLFLAPKAHAIVAYEIPSGTTGSQGFGGILGMDFDVEHTINVTSLGVFDSGSDGIGPGTTLTAELWSRSRGLNVGTSVAAFADDLPVSKLAVATFTAGDDGVLVGGSRFKDILGGLVLTPGAYTIVTHGYSAAELNGNLGVAPLPGSTTNDNGGSISFVGFGRNAAVALAGTTIGTNMDVGPLNRYGAGTFQ